MRNLLVVLFLVGFILIPTFVLARYVDDERPDPFLAPQYIEEKGFDRRQVAHYVVNGDNRPFPLDLDIGAEIITQSVEAGIASTQAYDFFFKRTSFETPEEAFKFYETVKGLMEGGGDVAKANEFLAKYGLVYIADASVLSGRTRGIYFLDWSARLKTPSKFGVAYAFTGEFVNFADKEAALARLEEFTKLSALQSAMVGEDVAKVANQIQKIHELSTSEAIMADATTVAPEVRAAQEAEIGRLSEEVERLMDDLAKKGVHFEKTATTGYTYYPKTGEAIEIARGEYGVFKGKLNFSAKEFSKINQLIDALVADYKLSRAEKIAYYVSKAGAFTGEQLKKVKAAFEKVKQANVTRSQLAVEVAAKTKTLKEQKHLEQQLISLRQKITTLSEKQLALTEESTKVLKETNAAVKAKLATKPIVAAVEADAFQISRQLRTLRLQEVQLAESLASISGDAAKISEELDTYRKLRSSLELALQAPGDMVLEFDTLKAAAQSVNDPELLALIDNVQSASDPRYLEALGKIDEKLVIYANQLGEIRAVQKSLTLLFGNNVDHLARLGDEFADTAKTLESLTRSLDELELIIRSNEQALPGLASKLTAVKESLKSAGSPEEILTKIDELKPLLLERSEKIAQLENKLHQTGWFARNISRGFRPVVYAGEKASALLARFPKVRATLGFVRLGGGTALKVGSKVLAAVAWPSILIGAGNRYALYAQYLASHEKEGPIVFVSPFVASKEVAEAPVVGFNYRIDPNSKANLDFFESMKKEADAITYKNDPNYHPTAGGSALQKTGDVLATTVYFLDATELAEDGVRLVNKWTDEADRLNFISECHFWIYYQNVSKEEIKNIEKLTCNFSPDISTDPVENLRPNTVSLRSTASSISAGGQLPDGNYLIIMSVKFNDDITNASIGSSNAILGDVSFDSAYKIINEHIYPGIYSRPEYHGGYTGEIQMRSYAKTHRELMRQYGFNGIPVVIKSGIQLIEEDAPIEEPVVEEPSGPTITATGNCSTILGTINVAMARLVSLLSNSNNDIRCEEN